MRKNKKPLDPSDWEALIPELENLINNCRSLPSDQAEALLTTQCEAIFGTHFQDIDSLEQALELAKQHKTSADKTTETVTKELSTTPKRLNSPLDNNSLGLFSGGLSQVRFGDAIQLILFAILICLSMYTAYANVLANLLSTGLPIFLENTKIASGIAMIAPASSVSIKILPSAFKRDAAQALCKRLITAITALGVLAWMILFAMSFDGLSNDLPDLTAFSDEPDYTANLLSFTQLFVEIMVSATLFIKFSDILAIYEPEHKTNNPEWDKLSADLEQAKLASTSAETAFEKANNALGQHKAGKQAFTNQALSLLANKQAQFRDLHR